MTARSAGPWALGLGLGAGGGLLFAWLHLPLPWVLGSMTACTVAALSGLRPAVPRPLWAVMIAVLGVLLGGGFMPGLMAQIARWSVSLSVLLVVMAVMTLAGMAYLRRFAGMSPVTAYFASAPGGVNEMVITGGALGGDEWAIALSHTLRILLIVVAVPVAFRLVSGVQSGPMAGSLGRLADLGRNDAVLLLAAAVIGVGVARLIRLPAAGLIGPLVVSAAFHLSGLTQAKPPAELVIVAQMVAGASIGCRFSGLTWRKIAGSAAIATGVAVIMLAASAGAAGALSLAIDLPFGLLLLAFVPGGIAEMGLIALALGQDFAFVSTHHLVRVLLVVVAAPLIFRLARHRSPIPPPAPPAPPPPGTAAPDRSRATDGDRRP